MIILLIAVGGGLGCVARYLLYHLVQPAGAGAFPVGYMVVNILGSFLIGFLYQVFPPIMAPRTVAFAGIGFCGGFTTFSSFSYDAVMLLREGDYSKACIYVVASVVCCLVGTICGMMLGKALIPR
jgi:CrcB protein